MHFEGEYKIKSQRQKVWEYVSDPRNAMEYVPLMKKVTVHSDNKFSIVVGVSVGSMSGTFQLEVDIVEEIPRRHVKFKASGSGIKSTANGEAIVDLFDSPNGNTVLKWAADGNVGGLIAGVGQRLMRMAAKKSMKDGFDRLRSKLEGGKKVKNEKMAAMKP